MAVSSGQVNITLNSYELYLGVIIIGAIAAILGFLTHTIPAWAGYAGAATAGVTVFAYLVDELVPATAWEYVTVTVLAAVVGEVGNLAGIQYVTLATVLVWTAAILSALYNSVSENGGAFLSSQQSTLFLGITGAGLAFVTWWAGQPNATLATIITTLVATVAQFLRVSVTASARALAARSAGPAPAK